LSGTGLHQARGRFRLPSWHPAAAEWRVLFHSTGFLVFHGIGFHGIGFHAGIRGGKRQSRKKNRTFFSRVKAMQTGQDRTTLCGPGRSEARHPGGWWLRLGDPMQCPIQAVTVVFTVIFATEFAIPPKLECTDFSTAIQALHHVILGAMRISIPETLVTIGGNN
jgi:hypothetical protein